jgi:L-galactose dehydrogenase
MNYAILGKTGLRVSVLGFGAAQLGDMYEVTDYAEGQRAVHYAIDNGINYFDVSPFYGRNALAEARLGEALTGRRHEVALATKVGQYDVDGHWVRDYSRARVFVSIEESLRRLRTDYIDVYQAHDINNTTAEQIIGETLPAMEQLRKQGKIRFLGITALPLDILKEVVEGFDVDTVLSFCRCNLVNTDLERELLPLLQKRNIGIINASPLHMGILTPTQKRPLVHGLYVNSLTTAVQKASAYCERKGTNIAKVAMAFALSNKDIHMTLCGMSKMHNVQRNIELVGRDGDPEVLAHVLQIIRDGIDKDDPLGLRGAPQSPP